MIFWRKLRETSNNVAVNFIKKCFPFSNDRLPEQKSAGINLILGQVYYMEVLLKEDRGNDHVSVGIRLPSSSEIKLIEKKYLYTQRPVIIVHKPVVTPVKPVLPHPSPPGMCQRIIRFSVHYKWIVQVLSTF